MILWLWLAVSDVVVQVAVAVPFVALKVTCTVSQPMLPSTLSVKPTVPETGAETVPVAGSVAVKVTDWSTVELLGKAARPRVMLALAREMLTVLEVLPV